jgi:hypothetical protein
MQKYSNWKPCVKQLEMKVAVQGLGQLMAQSINSPTPPPTTATKQSSDDLMAKLIQLKKMFAAGADYRTRVRS